MSNQYSSEYDLSDVLRFEPARAVRSGSNVLVSGPGMSGTDELALDVVASGLEAGQGGVVMTTSERGETVVERLEDSVEFDPANLCVVDCRAERGREERSLNGAYVYSVPEPSDFTGLGIGLTQCLSHLDARDLEAGRFALSSLSTMITYTDRQKVFKFCHVVASRLSTPGYLGLFVVDPDVHDTQTMAVIKQAFDGLVEVRQHEGTREARLVGLEAGTTEWQPLA